MADPKRSIFEQYKDMPTLDLTRELALEAELLAPDGIVPETMARHIIDITNRHLHISKEPKDLLLIAASALFLTDSTSDIEFMSDENVAQTFVDKRTVARGHLYSIEHLASVAYTGFGLRLFGVDVLEPFKIHVETLLVPVESVTFTLASK